MNGAEGDYLRLSDVTYRDGERTWLAALTLSVPRGQAVGVVAESGSGKSLLLKICLGLVEPTGGEVRVQGAPLAAMAPPAVQAWRARVGYVPQEGGLLSNLSVFDNVALPLRYHGALDDDAVSGRVMEQLERMEVADLRARRPAELDRAQRIRASVARALVMEPEALFLDDPFAKLARLYTNPLVDLLRGVRSRRPLTLVAVTRRVEFLGDLLDFAGILTAGRIEALGPAREMRALIEERTRTRARPRREEAP